MQKQFKTYVTGARKPPEWRWLMALDQHREFTQSSGKRRHKSKDPIIQAAAEYACEKWPNGDIGSASEVDTRELAHSYPEIYEANCIFEEGEDTTTRWHLEALVVARESRENIAEYLATTPDVIRVYEDLFFDVRERLANKGWANSVLIGRAGLHLNREDPNVYWKYLAMAYGLSALYEHWDPRPMSELAISEARKLSRSRTAKNMVDATHTAPFGHEATIALLNHGNDDRRLELQAAAEGGGEMDAARQRELINGLKFSVAVIRDATQIPTQGRLIEPRADHLLSQQLQAINIGVGEQPQLQAPVEVAATEESPE